jgi:broad specificity phosphatase PhoE
MGAVTAGSRPPASEGARTTLLLVRHGEAESNAAQRFGGWSPVPLTEKGRRQADAAARELAGRAPTALVSSDIVRAHQTAAPIAVACGLPIVLDARLRERSVGIFDGLAFAEAEARHPEAWKRLLSRDPDLVPEGAETVDQVFARVTAVIDELVATHAGGKVVVVTHGIALFHVFAHLVGLGSPRGHQRVFVLADNASITHVEHRVDDGRVHWRIHTVNDTAHLAGVG